MSYMHTGIEWISPDMAHDWLRTGADNDLVIGSILAGLPEEIHIHTGISADVVRSNECPELVRQLVLFMLLQRYDVTETSVDRVVDALTKSVQAMTYGEC